MGDSDDADVVVVVVLSFTALNYTCISMASIEKVFEICFIVDDIAYRLFNTSLSVCLAELRQSTRDHKLEAHY